MRQVHSLGKPFDETLTSRAEFRGMGVLERLHQVNWIVIRVECIVFAEDLRLGRRLDPLAFVCR